jgi:hypothetical protein
MGLLMRKNDRSFSSGGAPSPKKARLGSFVDLSRGARESSVKPHVLDNGTYRGARTSTRRGIGTPPDVNAPVKAPIERDFLPSRAGLPVRTVSAVVSLLRPILPRVSSFFSFRE